MNLSREFEIIIRKKKNADTSPDTVSETERWNSSCINNLLLELKTKHREWH